MATEDPKPPSVTWVKDGGMSAAQILDAFKANGVKSGPVFTFTISSLPPLEEHPELEDA